MLYKAYYPSVESFEGDSKRTIQYWQGPYCDTPEEALAIAESQLTLYKNQLTLYDLRACVLSETKEPGWTCIDVYKNGSLYRLLPLPNPTPVKAYKLPSAKQVQQRKRNWIYHQLSMIQHTARYMSSDKEIPIEVRKKLCDIAEYLKVEDILIRETLHLKPAKCKI